MIKPNKHWRLKPGFIYEMREGLPIPFGWALLQKGVKLSTGTVIDFETLPAPDGWKNVVKL